ncbi:hypothetical protein PGS1_09455 [Enterobacter cloacae subsp. cloacae GS1]|nr:hypothetical protein PGS1_09455 [Enterobacter cloacae subsp. cloacae GS1]
MRTRHLVSLVTGVLIFSVLVPRVPQYLAGASSG